MLFATSNSEKYRRYEVFFPQLQLLKLPPNNGYHLGLDDTGEKRFLEIPPYHKPLFFEHTRLLLNTRSLHYLIAHPELITSHDTQFEVNLESNVYVRDKNNKIYVHSELLKGNLVPTSGNDIREYFIPKGHNTALKNHPYLDPQYKAIQHAVMHVQLIDS